MSPLSAYADVQTDLELHFPYMHVRNVGCDGKGVKVHERPFLQGQPSLKYSTCHAEFAKFAYLLHVRTDSAKVRRYCYDPRQDGLQTT